MPGAIGDVQGVAPPASEEEESPMDPVPGVDRLPLKRKGKISMLEHGSGDDSYLFQIM